MADTPQPQLIGPELLDQLRKDFPQATMTHLHRIYAETLQAREDDAET